MVTGNGTSGYGAVDDFLFDNLEECPQYPEDSIVSQGNCDFQNDLCNEWVLPESPEQSFFNRTNAIELKNSGIFGPEFDELDDPEGKQYVYGHIVNDIL